MADRAGREPRKGTAPWVALPLAVLLAASGCAGVSVYGDTPLVLSQYVADGFERYKGEQGPAYFAVSQDGRMYGYLYCPGTACKRERGTQFTIGLCQQRSGGSPCKIFAVGTEIKWKGAITWPGAAGSARPAAPDSKQVAEDRDVRPVPMVIRWEDTERDIKGQLRAAGKRGQGRVHMEDETGRACDGTWSHTSGRYATGGPVTGTWLISCNDGLIAFGDYVGTAPLKGTATGKDTAGRKVVIRYGE